MTAREQQPKRIFGGGSVAPVGLDLRHHAAPVDLEFSPPDTVDRLVPRGAEDPGGRTLRLSVAPLIHSRREGILEGVFRELNVANDPDEPRKEATVFVAVEAVDGHGVRCIVALSRS